LLASKLALAADALGLLARLLHRRLLKGFPQSHFPEDALALELFLQDAKRLINIVVANQYLHLNLSTLAILQGTGGNLTFCPNFASGQPTIFRDQRAKLSATGQI
jgi:hypothetical protein